MAAYTSTQSGNFNDSATWGGAGWPNLDADTFTVAAGHTVTYNLTTALHLGLGSSVVNSGGTFIMDNNTVIRFNGTSTYHFAISGNFIKKPGAKTLLKGTTAAEKIYDIRPLSFVPTTATGTSGQNTITVASNVSQIIVNNKVSGTGIAAGAYVTGISGNVLTLSKNNTGAVSGNLTVGNYVEIIGSEGMPITTVSTAITTTEHQQGFINAANASQFVVGDWIAVYTRNHTDALTTRNDEGFIIHDISTNTIYIREFVGPTTTISSASTNTITVANAKIFRTWQKLIFGTGANRNIHSISSIDYTTNVITLTSNVVGTVTGLSVYTTGPLQLKSVGDKIRKVATTVSTQAVSTATQIVLSSAAGFNVGDEVIIDALWNTSATSYTDEFPEKRNITAINGNTITLNQSLGYIAFVGAFVTRITRDIKFISDYEATLTLTAAQSFAAGDIITQAFSGAKGVVKTATSNSTTVVVQDIFGQFITGTTNSPWLSNNGTAIATNVSLTTVTISTTEGHSAFGFARNTSQTTNQLPVLYFRDVQVGTFSNTGSTSSRFWIRGFWSSLANTYGGVEFEGITYCKPNQTDTFNYSESSIWINRYFHDFVLRCSTVWNTVLGITLEEGYDLKNIGVYNNISSRCETRGMLIQHLDHSASGFNVLGGAWELAYNYIHRTDDVGLQIVTTRTPGRGIHHNWFNVAQGRSVQTDITYTTAVLYQNRFQRYFEPSLVYGVSLDNFIYNEWIPANSLSDYGIDSSFQPHNFSITFGASLVSLEHNYIIDGVTIYIPAGARVWDSTEQAWRCYFDDDANLESGLAEIYYIPADSTLTARATIKLDPAFNGTAPKLAIRSCVDRAFVGTNGDFSGDQPLKGTLSETSFSATNTTTYQTVEVTIPAKTWGRSVTVGVINVGSNASEGWWEKPIEVEYSIAPQKQFIDTGINRFSGQIRVADSSAVKKVRITGGRIV